MISPNYRAQVDLLLRVLPYVEMEDSLALKGGTAINLFAWDMPRLSVDIDLTYLPFSEYNAARKEISDTLHRLQGRLRNAIPPIAATVVAVGGAEEVKLLCRSDNAIVKVEVNAMIRGHLWPTRKLEVVPSAQDEFGKSAFANVVSDAELYGGKICAALDRQHPRDLFDIHQLFAHGRISDSVRLGFLVMLLSHSRPIHEVLRPNFQDQSQLFASRFTGMALLPFTYEDFQATRER